MYKHAIVRRPGRSSGRGLTSVDRGKLDFARLIEQHRHYANTLAQIELWRDGEKYDNQVYVLPKHLDEQVARLHLDKIGAKLTTLSQQQSDYINVPVAGPYKPNHYRY